MYKATRIILQTLPSSGIYPWRTHRKGTRWRKGVTASSLRDDIYILVKTGVSRLTINGRWKTTISSNTAEGAIGTLKDSKWLSTTAIDMLFHKKKAKIYDRSFMVFNEQESILHKGSKCLKTGYFYLFPNHHGGSHWNIIVLDPRTAEIEFYDSIRSPEFEQEPQEATK